MGSSTDETTKVITLERRGSIRNITSTLKGVVSGVQKKSLLWIHALGFSGRYLEEFVVELVRTIYEICGMSLHPPAAFSASRRVAL